MTAFHGSLVKILESNVEQKRIPIYVKRVRKAYTFLLTV